MRSVSVRDMNMAMVMGLSPFKSISDSTLRNSIFLIPNLDVNIDPSSIKMVSSPNTMIYAKRYIFDF